MNIIRMVTGSYRVNTYLVAFPATRAAVIIDPGGNAGEILAAVENNNLQVQYILNTHGHADHILANQDLHQALSAPVCVHEADHDFFSDPEIRKTAAKELNLSAPDRADIILKDGEILPVGNMEILVIHTPGHTPGSCCFLIGGNLFTGDTLFVGDVGRTDLAGGSLPSLLQSIKSRLLILPLETVIHPGHDYGETPTSTLAWEMKENPYITDFILADE